MTSDQLNGVNPETIDRAGLSGVTMRLEKKNDSETYQMWDFLGKTYTSTASKASFTTRADGSYVFASRVNGRVMDIDGGTMANNRDEPRQLYQVRERLSRCCPRALLYGRYRGKDGDHVQP